MINKLWQVHQLTSSVGLVMAPTKAEAVRIARGESKRLLEERGDDQVFAMDDIDESFEPEYLLLNGDITYREALDKIARQE